jgi:nucleoside-diphosphate-sugar epimerase
MVYGPGDTGPTHAFLADYLRRRLPLVPLGSAYCWGHVSDIAQGHILAMGKGRAGESYFLAGPAHSARDALRLGEEITGVPPPSFLAPPWLLKALSGLMRVAEIVAPVPEGYSSEYLRVSAGVTYLGDNGKARRELGWSPRSLRDGFEETLRAEMDTLGIRPAQG